MPLIKNNSNPASRRNVLSSNKQSLLGAIGVKLSLASSNPRAPSFSVDAVVIEDSEKSPRLTKNIDIVSVYLPVANNKGLSYGVDHFLIEAGHEELVTDLDIDDEDAFEAFADAVCNTLLLVFPQLELEDILDEASFKGFTVEWVNQFNDLVTEAGSSHLTDLSSLAIIAPIHKSKYDAGENSHEFTAGRFKRLLRNPERHSATQAEIAAALSPPEPAPTKAKAKAKPRRKPAKK